MSVIPPTGGPGGKDPLEDTPVGSGSSGSPRADTRDPKQNDPKHGDQTQQDGLYRTPSDAVREVQTSYRTWTGQLTQRSYELSTAVIVANWATFGSINPLLSNTWAKASIGVVVGGLVVTIFGTWLMSEWLKDRIDYAEGNLGRWADEFEQYKTKKHPWPFTHTIEMVGAGLRITKTFIPLLGGIFYICALTSA
jgi:hypothetical protein